MDGIYDIIGKLLAAVLVGLLAWLAPKARTWFAVNADKSTQEKVARLVRSFARAAEQLFHDTDPTGERRKQFVRQQLTALGMEITETVLNMIEGEVWEINTENKKALVQTKELETMANDLGEASVREALARIQKDGGNGNG